MEVPAEVVDGVIVDVDVVILFIAIVIGFSVVVGVFDVVVKIQNLKNSNMASGKYLKI